MNLEFQQIYSEQILPWLIGNAPTVIAVLVLLATFIRFGHVLIEKIIRQAVVPRKHSSPTSEKKREDTLIRVFTTALDVAAITVAGMMILSELGIDTGPLIAGAGIAGVAIGFGGQYLIKDVINGFFIILENHYRVGDVLQINGGTVSGLVEDISLRMTILRDMDGTVHHVPNSEIHIASNMSKEYAQVNLNIGISYKADLEEVINIVNDTGTALSKSTAFKDKILTPPKFLRVDEFADSAVIIKIVGRTQPLAQWEVAGELRKRLKIAFDKQKIDIPFPQRVIHTTKD